jgi:hypothetical protein
VVCLPLTSCLNVTDRRDTPLKIRWNSSVFTMSLTLRPKSLASWSLCETDIISWLGSRPIYHAGNILLVIRLYLSEGGRKTISLLISPSATFCSLSHNSSMCLPILKSVTRVGACNYISLTLAIQDKLHTTSDAPVRGGFFMIYPLIFF